MVEVIPLTILHRGPIVFWLLSKGQNQSPLPIIGSHVKTHDTTHGSRGYEDIHYTRGLLERPGQASELAHLASVKWLVFTVVISSVRERFLYVHQGLHDLNFPTQAQGKRKHLGFLTSLPSCGSKGNQRNGTCKEMDSEAVNSQISKLESDALLHHYK